MELGFKVDRSTPPSPPPPRRAAAPPRRLLPSWRFHLIFHLSVISFEKWVSGWTNNESKSYLKDWVFLFLCNYLVFYERNWNFLFLSLCVYLFKNCPSQFLSHWKSAEPVFCSEELNSLPFKNQNSQLLGGKIQISCMLRILHKNFFHRATFMIII